MYVFFFYRAAKIHRFSMNGNFEDYGKPRKVFHLPTKNASKLIGPL